ncbi:hypothetical protein S245_044082, partial [Arachis hypogaea]
HPANRRTEHPPAPPLRRPQAAEENPWPPRVEVAQKPQRWPLTAVSLGCSLCMFAFVGVITGCNKRSRVVCFSSKIEGQRTDNRILNVYMFTVTFMFWLLRRVLLLSEIPGSVRLILLFVNARTCFDFHLLNRILMGKK